MSPTRLKARGPMRLPLAALGAVLLGATTLAAGPMPAPSGSGSAFKPELILVSQQTKAAPASFRADAVAAVDGGSAMRAEGAASVRPGPRVASYLVQSDTERPLASDVLAELIGLLQAPSGFDDSVIKRCIPGLSVGFRLTRGQEPVTELVLDFACDKLIVLDLATDEESSTDFGPSRAAFVALAKRALPNDSEIQSLD